MAISTKEVEESLDFLKHQPKKLFINNKWVESQSGKVFTTINPATGKPLAQVYEGDAADIGIAVKAARTAFDDGRWKDLPPAERARILWKIGDLIEENAYELAQIESLDNGKPINECLVADIPLSAAIFRYFAGIVTKIHGETIPVSFPGRWFNYTLRQPIGVVGAIIPWNFPLMMAAFKLGPALACGNTVVLKPAEQTPLSALRLAEIAQEAELPAGVLNVVPGFGETAGAALASHPFVDKIGFTGSVEVGKKIVQASTGNLKRVALELGGKSPNIIFADADMQRAVSGAFMGIFLNQGQVCSAGSRLFVQESCYDLVLEHLTEEARNTRLGPGVDPLTQMGPLVSQEQMDRVLTYISIGREEGAKLMVGGRRAGGDLKDGYFVEPTIFADVRHDMRIFQEEIFGPVLAATPFKDEDDLIEKANSTIYGLAAGVWTKDIAKAHRVAHALKAGTVWINCYNLIDPAQPWGGFKQSGWGRELGTYSIEIYTEVKDVWVNLD